MTVALLIPVILLSIVVHEWAHAAVADLEGDPTPRTLGRLTLDPVVHLDPLGSIIVPVLAVLGAGVVVGWCRPVPLTTALMRSGRASLLRVLAAGPAANLALALACLILVLVTGLEVFRLGAAVNLMLAGFNLLPIRPLDGGRILHLLREESR